MNQLIAEHTQDAQRRPASRIGAVGAFLLFLAVLSGAFGAHALKGRLDDYSLGVYQLAVSYQMYHSLGLLAVSLFAMSGLLSVRAAVRTAWLLGGGILVFSGSLFLLALTGVTKLGAITPVGGTLLLAGWLFLAWQLWRGSAPPSP